MLHGKRLRFLTKKRRLTGHIYLLSVATRLNKREKTIDKTYSLKPIAKDAKQTNPIEAID
jgi:hypothetical protein